MPIQTSNRFGAVELNSEIYSSLNLVKEDNAVDFYKAFPSLKGGLVAQLEAEGKIKYTPQERYSMWLDSQKQIARFTVEEDVVVTASAPVTLTVSLYADEDESLSAPEVGFFLWENSTGIEFQVTAVDKTADGAHEVTISPTSTGITETIPSADAEFLVVGRLSVQESSFQQEGLYRAWNERENFISIVRTNKAYSDLATMERLRVGDETYYNLDKSDMTQQHVDAKEWQFMHGKVRNNVTSTGNRNSQGLGLIALIQEYGTVLDGGGAGATLDMDFFHDLARALDGNGFGDSYEGLAGTDAFMKLTPFLTANNLGTVQINVNGGGDGDIKALFDYKPEFTIDGITYRFKKYGYFNTARLAGADSEKSALSNTILLMPTGAKADGSGEYRDALRVRYMDNDLPTDEKQGTLNHIDYDGALFNRNTTRNGQISLVSYLGADLLDAESFLIATLA